MFGGSSARAIAADAAVLCLAAGTGNSNNEAASTGISTGATVEPAGASSSSSGTLSAQPTRTRRAEQ